MARRRRRVIRVVKRSLPKVFSCPQCGVAAVRVTRSDDHVIVKCGNCDLPSYEVAASRKEPIDVYNDFVDQFIKGEVRA